MIVKNEAENIERALKSVAPYIDFFSILDTGSEDDTIGVIEEVMGRYKIDGQVHLGDFRDFSQARNDALRYARQQTQEGYLLLMDADMELVVTDTNWTKRLKADVYMVEQETTEGFRYSNYRLLKADNSALYVGATHEFLDVKGGSRGEIPGIRFIDHASGSNRAHKYERDLALLMQAFATDPSDTRTAFYLAQTHRDSGNLEAARNTYRLRSMMGGWEEEAWYALFQIATCTERLGEDPVDAYLRAWNARPTRAEPIHELARYYRERGQATTSAMFAELASGIPVTSDILFVDRKAYS